jgi:Circularly permutated YpsA SLOG family
MRLKIISGGQCGADIGGLRAAKAYGFPTGGCAAKGFKTENGVYPELESFYGLHDKGYDYVERTKENVRESDLTLVYADDMTSAGTKLTIDSCKKYKKPFRTNLPSYLVCDLLKKMNSIIPADKEFVINIAGNRETVAPGICARTERLVGNGLKMYKYIEKPPKSEEEEEVDPSW